MSDYTKLIEDLKRGFGHWYVEDWSRLVTMYADAAAAIEALEAENMDLLAEVQDLEMRVENLAGELAAEEDGRKFEPKRGDVVRCGECKNWRKGHGIPSGRVLCAKPFMGDTVAGAMHDADWYCGDGAKMEVQDGK